jgi:radical SAM superfamily enzyme YgiQ (UPF0313 family)
MKPWQQQERALAILSTEVGYVRKPHAGRLRVALAFPNTYQVGMSNLGFQTVYQLFNAHDDVACERVFLPPREDVMEQHPARMPLLTLESQTPVADVDVLAFSVSFEWDYPNVLAILRLAGLPVRAADRTTRHPLVVIGGAVTFVNPEPLAPFADVIAAGEGEPLVPALVLGLRAHRERDQLLRHLAAIGNFYVPSFYDIRYRDDGTIERCDPRPGSGAPAAVGKAVVKIADAVEPPCTSIFTPNTEFGSRFLVEVVRGCANLCRFCWAGYNYLPVRAFPAERILARAERARAHARRAGLVSIALCDHPDIELILARLGEMGYSISTASLRLDDLTETIVRRLRESGEHTFTIAPETGSDRLRRALNKAVTNDEILDRANWMFANGVDNLKLYYMIGLPAETDEDLVAIRDLTLQLRDVMMKHARPRGRVGRIVGSVNPMIPKPSTAYQWIPMEHPAIIERKARRLRALMTGIDNVRFTIKSPRQAFYQALLSLGDRRIAPAIEAADLNGGNWRRAVADVHLDADFYVFRDRRQDLVLPWEIVDGGVRRTFFASEFEKSRRAEPTGPPARHPGTTQHWPAPDTRREPDR